MFTQKAEIIRAGQEAARARREGDESRARFHTEWASKASMLENDTIKAWGWFNEAYKEYNRQYRR